MIDGLSLTMLVALVFGLLAGLRKEWPTIDGRLVYLAAFVLAGAVAFTIAPDPHAYRAIGWATIQIAAGAIALASGLNYAATKFSAPDPVATTVTNTIQAPDPVAFLKALQTAMVEAQKTAPPKSDSKVSEKADTLPPATDPNQLTIGQVK